MQTIKEAIFILVIIIIAWLVIFHNIMEDKKQLY